MRTKKLRPLMVVVTAVSLMLSVSVAFAHMDVSLKDSAGVVVTSTTPYSSKMTCGGCHFNCADSSYSITKSTWCDGSTGKEQKDCSVTGACPDYQSAAITTVNKVQGYQTAAGTIAFDSYDVTAPMHGASTGKHSTDGRNEGLTTAQRTIWAAPATISGPGMSGRY